MITVLVVVERKRKINITAVIVSVLILENIPFPRGSCFRRSIASYCTKLSNLFKVTF